MDPKELEEKLERDNLTLKEHIMKLQNTIKQIKSEIVNNPDNVCNVSNISNVISPIEKKENQRNKLKSSNDLDEKDNDLKFSFNNTGNIQNQNHNNSYSSNNITSHNQNSKLYKYSEDEESHNASFNKGDKKIKNNLANKDSNSNDRSEKIPPYKNVYQTNLEKLRKEKEIIQQMENFKKNNLKKKFDDDELDENEVDKFHQNYKNIKNEKFKNKSEYNSEDDERNKKESNFANDHAPVFNNSK
jgi:hypothetical protein